MQPPRPRFRYQIVYREKGDSFYHVRSLQKAYLDLNEVTKGGPIITGLSLAQCHFVALHFLHTSKFVHGDVSPGNIFSFEGGAKLSDLEFARERDVDRLSELTLETRDSSSPRAVEHLVVSSDGFVPHIYTHLPLGNATFHSDRGHGDFLFVSAAPLWLRQHGRR